MSQHSLYLEEKWQDDPKLLPEDRWVTLLDTIFRAASSKWREWTTSWRENRWRSHANTLVEGQRKPDIILVPKAYQSTHNVPFGAIMTYIEIKESGNGQNSEVAPSQVYQCAGFATACQINYSFFLGAMLFGRQLVLVLFAYGTSFFSEPFDIDQEPILFIKTVIALSSGLHPVLGFDTRVTPGINGSHIFKIGGKKINAFRQTWVRSITMEGRETKVPLCTDVYDQTQHFALKDCWLPRDGPNDVANNKALTSHKPKLMTKQQHKIFGMPDKYDIFRGCHSMLGTEWDYEKHLHSIPILEHATITTFEHDGKEEADTTEAIARRFSCEDMDLDSRVHVHTLSKTCGVPLSWFPCHRGFLGGMMCVVTGHFNGKLKGLLHSDISEPNIWICVNDPENANDVIPEWPADSTLYPKHPVVLGDWGMAEDRSPDTKVKNNAGGMTGTFPFLATELMSEEGIKGNITHHTHHDLEAMFWVMWIVSINMIGPYNQRRNWEDCQNDPFPGQVREPANAVGKDKGVPVWATPGIHMASPRDVFMFKRDIPEGQFFDTMSLYWSEGECGQIFKDRWADYASTLFGSVRPTKPVYRRRKGSPLRSLLRSWLVCCHASPG
ncbi:hypothetical protein JVT61DRAFT_1984 [Boletus reticuloceps]|uniref:Fungal-type protein kinase domain-containing protein n=1 Tax=Boletus reticuloceps TaxID=495285 RepID=A0A8I2YRC9_9AGAM|nr:hypothetical protein JVT61DRAFT_1984 [Boletus reticuloceps]